MTSDERIEIAERLHKTHGIMAFVDALGIDLDNDWCWTDVSKRVADLIDPTCHMVDTDHEYEDSIRCDVCQMTFNRPWEPFKFCPNCGARVTGGGEG